MLHTVVYPGNATIHAGRQAGTYPSGNPRYAARCGNARNARYDPMKVGADPAAITCRRCKAKLEAAGLNR